MAVETMGIDKYENTNKTLKEKSFNLKSNAEGFTISCKICGHIEPAMFMLKNEDEIFTYYHKDCLIKAGVLENDNGKH